MGGWRIFNSSLVFTVLLGFVMAVPAQAQRAEPQTSVINGNTVTLTYENTLAVDDYLDSEQLFGPLDSEGKPARDPITGEYKSGAYTCLHRPGHPEVSHTDVKVRGKQLIFTYPTAVGCNEGKDEMTETDDITFEMYNGDPYVSMDGTVVDHFGDPGSRMMLENQTPCGNTGGGGGGGGGGGNGDGDGDGNGDGDGDGNGDGDGDGNGDGDGDGDGNGDGTVTDGDGETAMVTATVTGMVTATGPRAAVSSGMGWLVLWRPPARVRSRAASA